VAKRLGVLFRPQWPPEDLPAFARRAEDDGFAELWLVEDCFLAGGLTMAATALASTRQLVVGIGLLPAALRNPALAAMEISGLARLHPGRFVVAFGHGVEPWMRQIDARPPDRLAALEETVASALEGDRLRALAVAGDARDCARAIAELWAAGADSIVLLPRSDARDEQIARFNAEVRPLL
jgi:alkanesulfonate monooxygenase SsuD/methylene tetrahydromethanopterin reductase-like flavin-dependent oxidoreductase (luciferase family)